MGFSKRFSTTSLLACWAMFACAQPQVGAVSEAQPAFEWEDPSQFPKYCIWRELAPVEGAACWELIVFNHTRETISVPLVSGQIGFALRTLRTKEERMAMERRLAESTEVILDGGGWRSPPYPNQNVFLIPPNYTERFRVVFPIGTQWRQAEVPFLGAASKRQFSALGPAIAPGVRSPLGMRVEVISASWQAEAADFEVRLSALDGWISENTWLIERPSANGWQLVPLRSSGLPLVPGASELESSIFRIPFRGRRVELYWPLRCLAVRATVPVETHAGASRSYAFFLPSYPCGEADCEICKFQRQERQRL